MTPQNPNRDDVYREYDWEKTLPSKAIIETVNTFETNSADVGIDETRAPLYDHIGTEALDAITSSATDFVISFTYADYTIQLDDEGVRVSPR